MSWHIVGTVSNPFQGCFKLDPSERLTCEQLLQHPYMERPTVRYQEPPDNQKRRPKVSGWQPDRAPREQPSRAPVSMQNVKCLTSSVSEISWILFMCVYVCVCVCVCVHVYILLFKHMCLCVCLCEYVCVCVCLCVFWLIFTFQL